MLSGKCLDGSASVMIEKCIVPTERTWIAVATKHIPQHLYVEAIGLKRRLVINENVFLAAIDEIIGDIQAICSITRASIRR